MMLIYGLGGILVIVIHEICVPTCIRTRVAYLKSCVVYVLARCIESVFCCVVMVQVQG
jgi:hypothetical protein